MKSTETVQPTAPGSSEPMTATDVAAHVEASYVRRPAVVEETVLPPLPRDPVARRRAIQQRGW